MTYYTIPLLYYAITGIHAGAGRGGKEVDLLIQRDAKGYPIIYKTSIKGAFRSYYRPKLKEDERSLFGERIELGQAQLHYEPGLISFSDAILLGLPVKLEKPIFIYVTTPYLLKRIKNLLSPTRGTFSRKISKFINNILIACKDMNKNSVVLSSLLLKQYPRNMVIYDKELNVIGSFEEDLELPYSSYPISEFCKRLTIVEDETFLGYFLDNIIIKSTKVRLDYRKKHVVYGGLWSEEFLPSGSILLGLLFIRKFVFKDNKIEEVKTPENMLKELFPQDYILLFLGGRESTSKGLIKVVLCQ